MVRRLNFGGKTQRPVQSLVCIKVISNQPKGPSTMATEAGSESSSDDGVFEPQTPEIPIAKSYPARDQVSFASKDCKIRLFSVLVILGSVSITE